MPTIWHVTAQPEDPRERKHGTSKFSFVRRWTKPHTKRRTSNKCCLKLLSFHRWLGYAEAASCQLLGSGQWADKRSTWNIRASRWGAKALFSATGAASVPYR